jgi:uncharacterized membrane protein YgdD (TMEM256/DUF423 family)
MTRTQAPADVAWTSRMNARFCLLAAALALAAAVALGAFGAHALKGLLAAEMLATYHTAVEYHFWHALGLLGVGVLMSRSPDDSALRWVAWLLIAGLLLFSGSLYLLALTGASWLGAVTPFGGVAFIAAWLWLARWAWER